MLHQIDIYIKKDDLSSLCSDLSIKIHGFLMTKLPESLVLELHKNSVKPLSIFTVDAESCYIVRVSCLNSMAKEIIKVFQNSDYIRVFGCDNHLEILEIRYTPSVSLLELASKLQAKRLHIAFVTPASYKSNGYYRHDACIQQYFSTVLAKLRDFEGITISKEQLMEAFSHIGFGEYSLTTAEFLTGGRVELGMVGYVELTIPPNCDYASILRLVLAYATYTGVGRGTAQGMGGIIVQNME